mmetsp:Transcript_71051/g.200596  ORF Transcript_71051/g.200596 Transcript_71051/m.200596 type:complete len:250 (+) Transcript_71051:48-797(+)
MRNRSTATAEKITRPYVGLPDKVVSSAPFISTCARRLKTPCQSASSSGSIVMAFFHSEPSLQAAMTSRGNRRSSSTCSCVLDGLPSRGPMTFASTLTTSCSTAAPTNLMLKLPLYRPTAELSSSTQRQGGPPSEGFTFTARPSPDVDTTSTEAAVLEGYTERPYSCLNRTMPKFTAASPGGPWSSRNVLPRAASASSVLLAAARDAAWPRAWSAQLRRALFDLDPSPDEPISADLDPTLEVIGWPGTAR